MISLATRHEIITACTYVNFLLLLRDAPYSEKCWWEKKIILAEKTLASGPQIIHRYRIICKFKGENFNLAIGHQFAKLNLPMAFLTNVFCYHISGNFDEGKL